jgi:hypothetical protein
MEEKKDAYKFKGKRPLGRHRDRRMKIRMDLTKNRMEGCWLRTKIGSRLL